MKYLIDSRYPNILRESLLDGFREHTKYGSGCVGNHTQENKTARFRVVQDCRFVEGHYPVREIREGEGGGFRTELLLGGGVGKAGLVHQLHTGTTRMQYPLEDVP